MDAMRLLPPLFRRHPNMVVATTATAFMHLAFGLTHFVQPERYQDEAFVEVYQYIPEWVWGVKGILIWLVMTIGAYTNRWVPAKIALGVGMFFALLRGITLEIGGGAPGAGAVIWVWVAVIHYVQIAEPATPVAYVKDES